MKYEISAYLYDEAVKAITWYETTGMKVAKPPAIPKEVANWIYRHCIPITKVVNKL